MSAVDPQTPAPAPAPFTLLGDSGVGVCEGDVCVMPGTLSAPAAEPVDSAAADAPEATDPEADADA